MTVPLFSLRVYKHESLMTSDENLNPENCYEILPNYINSMWTTFSRDDIFAGMAKLLVGESLRVAMSDKLNMYILIQRQEVVIDDIISLTIDTGNDKFMTDTMVDDSNEKGPRGSSFRLCCRWLCFV